MTVDVTSAEPLDEAYRQKLSKALTTRLQRQVTLQCEVEPSLIGGAIVRAGDIVIDGSIRGKLLDYSNHFKVMIYVYAANPVKSR